MILSIVSGTYNRLRYLQRMLFSARQRIPRGFDYEFVIVDGGSTDGTLDWLREQPDVHLIEHGELLGAIRAFTEGALAAKGRYVLLANDDIAFVGDGIVKAIVYLETHANAGAVAFADDRPAPSYENGYKVQRISAVLPGGARTSVVYAQVGLFRRDLGNLVGWWGWHDPMMQKSRTYGGDSYLSARLWEFGYTVDAVEGCRIDDLIAPDTLRADNTADALSKPSPYYERYPNGVQLPAQTAHVMLSDQPRVLYLPIYEPGNFTQQYHKRGLRQALQERFLVYESDYCNDMAFDLKAQVETFRPDLLLMQCHDARRITPATLAQARALWPEMVVVNWNGDVYEQHLVGDEMLAFLRYVDVQLVVNASVLPVYEAHGIPAAYWQIGYEPVAAQLPQVHAHDIVFLANAYSVKRHALGKALKALPYDVGLYGYGWPDGDGNTLYDFTAGAALYKSAKIAIGDNQWGEQGRGFVSNRLFESLASGAFLLHQAVPGLEDLTGIRDGEHYVSWTDAGDLVQKIECYMTRDKDRRRIAKAGMRYVREHHSFSRRVEQLFEDILPKVMAHDPG